MLEKQKQEAGDYAQQVQINGLTIQNGIDEKRAREIVDEKIHEVVSGYTQEAREVAEGRINQFANDLIPKLVKDNLLEALRDPSIQVLLMDAQKSAAATERPADYTLLAELLVHRVQGGSDRSVRIGVNHAVKIVDEITDEALIGLTVTHAVSHFIPTTGNLREGLNALNNLFGRLFYSVLPDGQEWIEQAEILNAVRISPLASLKKVEEYYPEILPGYIDVGIKKDSENFQKALELIKENRLPDDLLCEHELRHGYVRLRITNIDTVNSLELAKLVTLKIGEQDIPIPAKLVLTETQIATVKSIYKLYSDDNELKKQNIAEFIRIWDEYENLKKLGTWWDAIPLCFNITSVGRVLAQANAQRCDSTLPSIDKN